jgi:hypothetical protein
MSLRLPMSGLLLALASLALADGVRNPAVPYAGLAIGVALIVNVLLDAIWLHRERQAP